MTPAPDPSTVFWLAGIMVTVIMAGGTWAWNHTHKRIDGKAESQAIAAIEKITESIRAQIDHEVRCVRVELKQKADTDDVKKALENIERLFEKAEVDRKVTRDLFDKAMETQQTRHDQIMQMINRCVRQ